MAEYCGDPLQKIESALTRTILLRVHNSLHRLRAAAQFALRMNRVSYEADVHPSGTSLSTPPMFFTLKYPMQLMQTL
jgi:hypothetical protein